MSKRALILAGMAGGLLWAVAILWIGAHWTSLETLAHPTQTGLFLAGLPLLAMIARLAQRRFFDDQIIDGQPFAPGSADDITQRVLKNTVEQLALALCIWPLTGALYGPGIVVALGAAFAVTRLLFWIGYHLSPPLRGFGFAASFYPTVLAAFWSVWGAIQ